MKRLVLLLAATWALGAHAEDPLPLFDAHMHYNVETRSYQAPEQVIALWRKILFRSAS